MQRAVGQLSKLGQRKSMTPQTRAMMINHVSRNSCRLRPQTRSAGSAMQNPLSQAPVGSTRVTHASSMNTVSRYAQIHRKINLSSYASRTEKNTNHHRHALVWPPLGRACHVANSQQCTGLFSGGTAQSRSLSSSLPSYFKTPLTNYSTLSTLNNKLSTATNFFRQSGNATISSLHAMGSFFLGKRQMGSFFLGKRSATRGRTKTCGADGLLQQCSVTTALFSNKGGSYNFQEIGSSRKMHFGNNKRQEQVLATTAYKFQNCEKRATRAASVLSGKRDWRYVAKRMAGVGLVLGILFVMIKNVFLILKISLVFGAFGLLIWGFLRMRNRVYFSKIFEESNEILRNQATVNKIKRTFADLVPGDVQWKIPEEVSGVSLDKVATDGGFRRVVQWSILITNENQDFLGTILNQGMQHPTDPEQWMLTSISLQIVAPDSSGKMVPQSKVIFEQQPVDMPGVVDSEASVTENKEKKQQKTTYTSQKPPKQPRPQPPPRNSPESAPVEEGVIEAEFVERKK